MKDTFVIILKSIRVATDNDDVKKIIDYYLNPGIDSGISKKQLAKVLDMPHKRFLECEIEILNLLKQLVDDKVELLIKDL
ncbi:hypothetical protein [Clostridium sp.]|uniref:hypothetical protein n=1 Tax=Clostridium sp. TaxID=1506 RepID=UPI002FCC20E9